MLILARRPGERVVIGDEILVTVMEVSASTVRLGIEAPRGVSIFREEIWLAVKEENRAAAAADPNALPLQAGELPPRTNATPTKAEEALPQIDAPPAQTDAPPAQTDATPTQTDEAPAQAGGASSKPVES